MDSSEVCKSHLNWCVLESILETRISDRNNNCCVRPARDMDYVVMDHDSPQRLQSINGRRAG